MSSTDMALGNLRNVENGNIKMESKETNRHGKTAHNMSSSSLRKKSDLSLVSKVKFSPLRKFLANIQEVILGTKLSILFSAIPLAIIADTSDFGRPWVFAFSLLGLIPLAERVSFLTEQTAYYTGEAVGGLLNATCGNATEIIISLFALYGGKIDVLKYTLLGSILSNLLLVLGTALLCGGLAYLRKDQKFDKRQGDVNCSLLLLGLLCHLLSLLLKYGNSNSVTAISVLQFSRVGSIFMLFIYFVYLIFQLKTHRQLFESQEDDDEEAAGEEKAVIGFISAVIWLVGMTIVIALLSEYVVATIEEASKSWGMSVSFLSIILLPIVGNAAEHAGAIIFAFKDKLDISLGVALGSATQISMFAVPLIVVVAWGMGIPMDLDFNILETASLLLAILTTAYVLQIKFSEFVSKHIGECEGIILEAETGNFLGMHRGFWFYTIGQRQGLRLPGGPWYVVEKDVKNNVVFVSRNYFSFDKRRRRFRVCSLKWLSGSPPYILDHLQCKVRHGPDFYDCDITIDKGELDKDSTALVTISKDDQGLAAGQFAAFYRLGTCIGSGIILDSWDEQSSPVCAKSLEIAKMNDKSLLGRPIKIKTNSDFPLTKPEFEEITITRMDQTSLHPSSGAASITNGVAAVREERRRSKSLSSCSSMTSWWQRIRNWLQIF